MDEQQFNFRLKEFEYLRREIELLLAEDRMTERYIIVAVATIWAWLATQRLPPFFGLAWWIPVFIVVAGLLRLWVIVKRFGCFGSYLIEFESALNIAGWENFLKKNARIRPFEICVSFFFWTTVLGATIAVAMKEGPTWSATLSTPERNVNNQPSSVAAPTPNPALQGALRDKAAPRP